LITADKVAAAGRLIRRGATFSLGAPIIGDCVQGSPRLRMQPVHMMTMVPGDLQLRDGAGFADDVIMMPLQSGTQWDGLAHCFYDGQMYNGYPSTNITAFGRAMRLGIDRIGDGVVGRGVLLDIAAEKGVEYLPAGCAIGPRDLAAAEERQGVRVGAGDILLVRTGWRRKLASATRRPGPAVEVDSTRLLLAPEPGLSQESCAWLHERNVAAVASDNHALEVIPVEDARATLPVHCILIRDMGMTLGELFDLETLAADCAADGVSEFFFAAPPIKVTRGLGSPINPIAIK
jgi:kynurenine formamidase